MPGLSTYRDAEAVPTQQVEVPQCTATIGKATSPRQEHSGSHGGRQGARVIADTPCLKSYKGAEVPIIEADAGIDCPTWDLAGAFAGTFPLPAGPMGRARRPTTRSLVLVADLHTSIDFCSFCFFGVLSTLLGERRGISRAGISFRVAPRSCLHMWGAVSEDEPGADSLEHGPERCSSAPQSVPGRRSPTLKLESCIRKVLIK